jgi:hypothetical protein
MSAILSFRRSLAATAAAALIASSSAFGAATIVIVNNNAAGVGFNDPTPVAPVGGNPGTTLGQQRQNAVLHAANIWGAALTSSVTIFIQAQFIAQTCDANSAVLASAGPTFVFRNNAAFPFANTWYHAALADKLAGAELNAGFPDINANFNINLGQPGCLTGIPFYLGLDNNHGAAVDLVATALHEFGHGLGFSTTTSGATGALFSGSPSSYDHFTRDNTLGNTWVNLTAAQRQASAINTGNLVWSGPNVAAAAPSVLSGTPRLVVSGNFPAVNGTYVVGTASFGPPLNAAGVSADVMPVVDQPNGTGLACDPLSPLNAVAVNGRIAMVDRGVCGFTVKVKNAQDAGAMGVLVVDNVAGAPPPGLGGTDPTITIPAVRITLADGNALKAALQFRSRTQSGVVGTLNTDPTQLAGADAAGRVRLFAPNPFQGGSSVSHWDTPAVPNLLMEPSISGDLTHSVMPPQDLTVPQLRDIGW